MEEYLNIVRKFKTPKILVVGDFILDEYIFGNIAEVSREAPVMVVEAERMKSVLGGAANTANNIRALGDKVFLVGVIGSDKKGETIKKLVEKKGINSQGIFVDQKKRTTVKTRVLAEYQQPQQLIRINVKDAKDIDSEIEGRIFNFIKDKIGELNAIIISDAGYGVITESLARNVIDLTRKNQVLCLVDFKGSDDYLKYKNCDIITPTDKDLASALNIRIKDDNQLTQAARTFLTNLACNKLLVKRAEKGMILFGNNEEALYFPAINKKARDVSGAGDTAIAILTLALSSGADYKQALTVASHACGIVVGKLGTAIVTQEELEEKLKNL